VLGLVHWAVLAGVVTPTALEQTRTDTVLVDAPEIPMLAMARLEMTVALGGADCEGDDVPWIAYSIALRAAELSDVATRKKYPKSTA
jgi:hypothetical protein